MRTRGVGYVCVTTFFTASVGAQTVELPGGDMRTQTVTGWAGANPTGVQAVAGRVFYRSTDPIHGSQWWVTDGTPAGTSILGDETSSWVLIGEMSGSTLFRNANGSLAIPANTRQAIPFRASGPQLWPAIAQVVSGATRTMMAVYQGPNSNRLWTATGNAENAAPIDGLGVYSAISPMAMCGDLAYVYLSTGGSPSLHVTDGTAGGTRSLGLPASSMSMLARWRAIGGKFYFQPQNGPTVGGLYVSEGTPESTRRLDTASNFVQIAGELGGELVYGNATSLRMTRGAETPITLATNIEWDISPNSTVWNGNAYCFQSRRLVLVSEEAWSIPLTPRTVGSAGFVVTLPNGPGMVLAAMTNNLGRPQLWTTDGTVEGTRLAVDLGFSQPITSMEYMGLAKDASGRSRVIFATQLTGMLAVYGSDGTPEGTHLLTQARTPTGPSFPRDAFVQGGSLYVDIDAAATGRERYQLNGETGDLVACEPMVPGTAGIARTQTLSTADATYSIASAETTSPVVRGAATPGGVGTVVASWPGVSISSGVLGTGVIFGDRLLFRGPAPVESGGFSGVFSTLWETDLQGRARPLANNTWLSDPRMFFEAESAAWCVARQSQNGAPGLFRYDGEAAVLFVPMAAGEEYSEVTAVVGSRVVVRLTSGPYGMFSVDLGTGERRVITSGPAGDPLTFGGFAYFAEGTTTEWRIRRTDGTAEGTSTILERIDNNGGPKLLAVGPGPDGRDRLYFSVTEHGHGNELWMTDGTTAGTVRVTDIGADILDANPTNAVAVGNRLCFLANDHEHGREWWATDGETTTRLTDLEPGAASIRVTWAKSVGSRVLFDAMSSLYGRELWMLTVECPADFNGDGFVDFFDYADFVACYEGGECPGERSPDFNRDDFVDFFDYIGYVEAFELGC